MLSFVVACYNVSPYLDDFFDSLERQTGDWKNVEYILVDDGSTDDTLNRITTWHTKWNLKGRVISKINGGAGSARNEGIKAATGNWISFPDPDDYLSDNYIEEIAAATKEDVDIISCRMVCFNKTRRFNHNLDWKYDEGSRIVVMKENPEYIQLSYASSVLKLGILKENNLFNDSRIRPTFEDAHLVCRYLLQTKCRMYILSSAVYNYRKREGSLVNSSWTKREKYNEQMIYGYLDILKRSDAVWLKNTVLYDLFWYIDYGSKHRIESEYATLFYNNMKRISKYIPLSVVKGFKSSNTANRYRWQMIRLIKGARVELFGKNTSSIREMINSLKKTSL